MKLNYAFEVKLCVCSQIMVSTYHSQLDLQELQLPLFALRVEKRLPKLQVSESHLICSIETERIIGRKNNRENERKKKEIENEREKLRIIGIRRR